MDEVIRVVYGICGITAVPGPADQLGGRFSCASSKYELPLDGIMEYVPELRDVSDDLEHHHALGVPRMAFERPVILWETGEIASVLTIENDVARVTTLVGHAPATFDTHAHAWTLFTNDLARIAARTSLRSMQNFFQNVVRGTYDEVFQRMDDADERKELAANLVLRLAPDKLPLFGAVGERMMTRLRILGDDAVVLTAMAAAGDLRVLSVASDPQNLLYALVRARRLFAPYGKGAVSVFTHVDTNGGRVDSHAAFLAKLEGYQPQMERVNRIVHAKVAVKVVSEPPVISDILHETDNVLAEELRKRRAQMGYVDELPGDDDPTTIRDDDDVPEELNLMRAAIQTSDPPMDKRSLDDLRAELSVHGFPRAHLLDLEDARALLSLYESDRDAYENIRLRHIDELEEAIQQRMAKLRSTDPDQLRFLAISVGVPEGDIRAIAEATEDPLRFQSASRARARAAEVETRTGRSTFELRRAELQRRLGRAS